MDPHTEQGLAILSHAIEYLANEYVFAGGALNPNRGQIEAIELLMARNRELYLSCPEVPSLWQRLRSLLHISRIRLGEPGRTQLNRGRI